MPINIRYDVSAGAAGGAGFLGGQETRRRYDEQLALQRAQLVQQARARRDATRAAQRQNEAELKTKEAMQRAAVEAERAKDRREFGQEKEKFGWEDAAKQAAAKAAFGREREVAAEKDALELADFTYKEARAAYTDAIKRFGIENEGVQAMGKILQEAKNLRVSSEADAQTKVQGIILAQKRMMDEMPDESEEITPQKELEERAVRDADGIVAVKKSDGNYDWTPLQERNELKKVDAAQRKDEEKAKQDAQKAQREEANKVRDDIRAERASRRADMEQYRKDVADYRKRLNDRVADLESTATGEKDEKGRDKTISPAAAQKQAEEEAGPPPTAPVFDNSLDELQREYASLRQQQAQGESGQQPDLAEYGAEAGIEGPGPAAEIPQLPPTAIQTLVTPKPEQIQAEQPAAANVYAVGRAKEAPVNPLLRMEYDKDYWNSFLVPGAKSPTVDPKKRIAAQQAYAGGILKSIKAGERPRDVDTFLAHLQGRVKPENIQKMYADYIQTWQDVAKLGKWGFIPEDQRADARKRMEQAIRNPKLLDAMEGDYPELFVHAS